MSERLEEAVNELKRADHMIFVSLKYTRTVDVIKNILERLILCFDATFDYLTEELKEAKKIEEVPKAKTRKIEILKEYFKDKKEFQECLDFYMFLKRINKAEFTRRQEFRRHVTMSVILEDKTLVEINIDLIHEYYEKTKAFLDFAAACINPEE